MAQQNGIKPAGGGGSSDTEKGRKLFIGGLTYSTTDDMLREFYSKYGELTDCIVMRDSTTKRSRGFGFITYADVAMVDAAMAERPHTIDGKVIEPKRAIPRDMSQRSEANMTVKKLYVSGVRDNHTEEQFKEYFSQYGNVESAEIITEKNTGKKRGFAFVSFDDYDSVDKCVLERSHYIEGMRCDVKKALGKDEINKSQQKERERSERDTRSRGTGRMGGGGGPWSRGGGGGGYGNYGDAPNWNQGGAGWNQGGGWNQSWDGYGGGAYGQYGGPAAYDQSAGWGQQPQQSGWGGAAAGGQPSWGGGGWSQQGGWQNQGAASTGSAVGSWSQQPAAPTMGPNRGY